jgi:hypothetical protein
MEAYAPATGEKISKHQKFPKKNCMSRYPMCASEVSQKATFFMSYVKNKKKACDKSFLHRVLSFVRTT